MAVFEFKKSTYTMEIAGNKFEVDPLVCDRYRAKFAQISKKLLDDIVKSAYSDESVQAYLSEAVKTIDNILGDGATARIYSGRVIDYLSICDILAFIARENEAFYTRYSSEYPKPMNREQKRYQEYKKK
ncbi:MAG: hypothetical protein RR205_04540 [Oscillospiraceae bacterium]